MTTTAAGRRHRPPPPPLSASSANIGERRRRRRATWLVVAAAFACLAPIAGAAAADLPQSHQDGDVLTMLRRVATLSDADAAAQKGTGLALPAPSIGTLQGPTVRLWDEIRVQPQHGAPGGGGSVGGGGASITIAPGK